jgi:hypothetical protein
MRFYNIECTGQFLLDIRSGSGLANTQGRLIYDSDDDQMKFNDGSGWLEILNEDTIITNEIDTDEAEITQLTIPGVASGPTGPFSSIDCMVGNVWASNELSSHSETYRVLENGSDGTNAWFKGDIRSDNGVACLTNGATPGAAIFTGTAAIATAAKYS